MKMISTSISCLILSLLCMESAAAQSQKPFDTTPQGGPDSPMTVDNSTYATHSPIYINSPINTEDYSATITVHGQVIGQTPSTPCSQGFAFVGYVKPGNLSSVTITVRVMRKGKEVSLSGNLEALKNKKTRINDLPLCNRDYDLRVDELHNCPINVPNGTTKYDTVYIIYITEHSTAVSSPYGC